MKRNETLKAMLSEFRPDLGNGNEYICNLQQRLETIETVKRMYEEERRRMRNRLVVAFVSGGIVGMAMSIYLLVHPITQITLFQYSSIKNPQDILLLSDWIAANVDSILTILSIPVFSVLAATLCTLIYQILKKDYSSITVFHWQ